MSGASPPATGLSSQAIEPVSRLDPDGLQSLALRCQQTDEPDRILSWDIWEALGEPEMDEWSEAGSAPAYTVSIDAAITTVPTGWRWIMREGAPSKSKSDQEGFFARLETHDFKTLTWGKGECWITDLISGSETSAWAKTPALALCAASLNAIAIEARSGETGTGSTEGESAAIAPKGAA